MSDVDPKRVEAARRNRPGYLPVDYDKAAAVLAADDAWHDERDIVRVPLWWIETALRYMDTKQRYMATGALPPALRARLEGERDAWGDFESDPNQWTTIEGR